MTISIFTSSLPAQLRTTTDTARSLQGAKAIDASAMDKIASELLAQMAVAGAALGAVLGTLRLPTREALSAGEARKVIDGLPAGGLIGPISAQRQQLMERAATLTETGVRQAVANGANESPERLKAGTEHAMLKTLAEAKNEAEANGHFRAAFDSIASGTHRIAVPDSGALEALRDSGLLEDSAVLSSQLDALIAMHPDERVEKSRTDAVFAMMVLLMTLLMALSETDRKQGAASLIKAESFVKAAGERLVASAEEHKKGAAIALGTTVAIAGAGLGVMAYGTSKNVKSIDRNELNAVGHSQKANKQALDLASGEAKAGGGAMSAGQKDVLTGGGSRTAAATNHAQHARNTAQNSMPIAAGQSTTQMGNAAGNVAQADGDAKAAEESRIKENLTQAAEVSRKTSENQQQEAVKARESTDEVRRQLAALGDTQAATRDAITRNIGA